MSLSNSLSNNNNTMKVKVILGNDIRRWRYSKSSSQLSLLKEFVITSFSLNNFWLQYEDDEGDRLTLSSQTDFEDAFACAVQEERKSLKIYVVEGSIQSAQRNKSIQSPPPQQQQQQQQSSSSPPPTQEQQQQQQEQQKPCQPDPDCNVNQCFEMRAAAINFLENGEIMKLLPEVFRRVMAEIKKSKQLYDSNKNDEKNDDEDNLKWDNPKSIEKIIKSILSDKEFEPITKHELYNKKIA
eukprot:62454_1